jgi:hypothetical protein
VYYKSGVSCCVFCNVWTIYSFIHILYYTECLRNVWKRNKRFIYGKIFVIHKKWFHSSAAQTRSSLSTNDYLSCSTHIETMFDLASRVQMHYIDHCCPCYAMSQISKICNFLAIDVFLHMMSTGKISVVLGLVILGAMLGNCFFWVTYWERVYLKSDAIFPKCGGAPSSRGHA